MKHKTKNRVIKKKGRKTKKMKMRRGGGVLDYFMSSSVNIPGFGSAGRCQSRTYNDPNYGPLEEKCYITPLGEIYKIQYPDSAASGAASGAADGSASGTTTPTKPWYQFW